MKRRGQVSIFIIAAILIVLGVGLFFLIRNIMNPSTEIDSGSSGEVQTFFDSCIEGKIKEVVNEVSIHGGSLENPLSREFTFTNEETRNYSYLCYATQDYTPCINQVPVLNTRLKREIEKGIKNDVEECYNEMIQSFEDAGFSVNKKYGGYGIILIPGKVILNVKSDTSFSRTGENKTIGNFEISVPTKLHEISEVVSEIVSRESTDCDFENLGYMMLYNDFEIDKFKTGDGEKIYTVTHKDSEERFRFATRSCVLPPGY